ncbi:MAG: DUF1343 domain-containing protein [Chlorobiaceae bacterium]|nr:DUF1343 domain-containing protein [Chlorobiaceae bacterium]
MKSFSLSFIVSFIFFLLTLTAFPAGAEGFRYGLDVLDADGCRQLKGKKVALITNAAAVSGSGEDGYRVLLRHGVDLRFLMAPEHGFALDREAGQMVGDAGVADTLSVYSLYGASKKPDSNLLKTVDLVVFDLQDAGVRCYTYISTMKLAMEACQDAGIAFMVLDRPNPIAPLPSGGFLLDRRFESFVGAAELPFLHGMTTGEIALWLQQQRYQGLLLQVVGMKGYRHDLFVDELNGYHYRAPSPALRDFRTLLLYPATVMLEATDVSEGRGTKRPFRMFGAPFIESEVLLRELENYNLPGIDFGTTTFVPVSGKFSGVECHGITLKVTDRKRFDPFMTATAILLSLQKLWPVELGIDRHTLFFDHLAGTDRYRQMIRNQQPIGEVLEAARLSVQPFIAVRDDGILYP